MQIQLDPFASAGLCVCECVCVCRCVQVSVSVSLALALALALALSLSLSVSLSLVVAFGSSHLPSPSFLSNVCILWRTGHAIMSLCACMYEHTCVPACARDMHACEASMQHGCAQISE